MGIEYMDLAIIAEMLHSRIQYASQGRKVLYRGGEYDDVEGQFMKDPRKEISIDKFEIMLAMKYPGSLLQFRKVKIQAYDAASGDRSQLSGQPTIPAAYFQDPCPSFPDIEIVQ